MRLNRSTDIGLRVLMLAAARADDLLTIDELATSVAVPRNHLAKVVQRLQHLGLLETVRGRNGGVRIAAGASSASVGGLVRDLEGASEVVECEGDTPCPLSTAGCRLRGALRVAQEAFYVSLDPITVGELAAPPVRQVLLTLGAFSH